MKKVLGVLLILCAYAMLYPGLTQPILSVSGTVEKEKLVDVGKQLIQDSPNTPAFVNNMVDMVVQTLDVSGTVNAFAFATAIASSNLARAKVTASL